MRFLRNIPIRRKLVLMISLANLATLLAVSGTLFVFQYYASRKTIMGELSTQAAIVAYNSAAALSFNDPQAAEETLKALGNSPHILEASLHQTNGAVLAHFGARPGSRSSPEGMLADGFRFEGPQLSLGEPVMLDSRRIGTLCLLYDFQAKQDEIIRPYLLALGGIVPASFLLALLLSSFLQRFISLPILRLAGTARAVAERDDYSVRADWESRDELGLLTTAFNHMLAQLEAHDATLHRINEDLKSEVEARKRAHAELQKLHREMVEVSRQAGMAEVATGVLHNVGNVLNSVNVSSQLVGERMRGSKVPQLARLAGMLKEHEPDLAEFLSKDDKGRQIPVYLSSLARMLGEEQAHCLRELELLQKNIEHIKEIVTMQQNYATVVRVVEQSNVVDLVEDAVKLNSASLERHEVNVERQFSEVPVIEVEKHKVLQILINLIRNAKYALDEGRSEGKVLTLRVERNGGDTVRIQVADNGVGISPENLTRIFAHGFTTRRKGHGFGLHSGALAARELGGSLTAQSDGPGHGATFTLTLPLKHEQPHE